MGLFSDTKKFPAQLVVNYPSFSFDEFKQIFFNFLESSECKDFLSKKGISIDGTLNLELTPDDRFETTFKGEVAVSPKGSMVVALREKGENQGLVLEVFSLEINFNLKKSEKKTVKDMMGIIKDYYDKNSNLDSSKGNAYIIAYTNFL